MSRIVRCALIQASNVLGPEAPLAEIKQRMIDKHLVYIRQAAEAGAQIVCLQEIFYGPYFCAEQETRWYDSRTELVPDGPTTRLMQDVARRHHIALIVPVYYKRASRRAFTTTPPPSSITTTEQYLGKYRKTHIPHVAPGFWEKFYFSSGQSRLSGLRSGLRRRSAFTSGLRPLPFS